MAISRRTLVRGLGAGMLGAGALTACGEGGMRRGRRRATTPPPTAEALSEPETPLVIGQIGANYGRMAKFEEAIAVSITMARIDVNARWDGLFGYEVELSDRYVMQEPGEDLTPVIQGMADSGVTCVITSIDEESLIAAMPALVEAGIAVIDVFTSGRDLRQPEVQTANLLVRLSPSDLTMALQYADIALGSTAEKAGPQGTIAYLSEDTLQGRSLLYELEQELVPRNGSVVSQQFYEVGNFGDIAARVKAVMDAPPSLLIFNGGAEAAPFLSALYSATLDPGQRPKVEFPKRLAPAATVDFSREQVAEDLVPECLTSATSYEPGAEITKEHQNMMLNLNADFLRTGYAYSQQGYDAFTMACLAAQHALSVEGTALAGAIPAILTGSEACTDYGMCRQVMRTGLEAEETATVAYSGRMGKFELGPEFDARLGELREYTWSEANVLEPGTAKNFEAPE
ncbi:ABC transporter substrate-binding protein [Brachybacterium sp. AOP35-5H-19]|uniref:ABC transporter substrate-binding protein n=1 Tax=Brachybacterium sp. AOP35-5H-19 TaxID=3457685 RepID=UPI0040336B19